MVNSGHIKSLYPQLNIDAMKEVRPVDTKLRRISSEVLILLLRLPENDQVKSNVKRIGIDFESFLDQSVDLELAEVMLSMEMSIPNEKSGPNNTRSGIETLQYRVLRSLDQSHTYSV